MSIQHPGPPNSRPFTPPSGGLRPAPPAKPERDQPPLIVLITIVGLVVAIAFSITWPYYKHKFRKSTDQQALASLADTIRNLKQCISDGDSWSATLADKGNPETLRCALDKAGCADGARASIKRLLSVGSSGKPTLCVPGYDLANPAIGLTTAGAACGEYSEAGNKACPFRLEMTFVPHCPSGTKECPYPSEEIVFALKSKSESWLKSDTASFTDGIDRPGFGSKQTVSIYRAIGVERPTVVVVEALPAGSPGGYCPGGGLRPAARRLNTVVSDPDGRVAVSNNMVWLRAGQYDCNISAPGYKVGSFRAQLVDMSTKAPLIFGSSEYSSSAYSNVQTRSVGSGRFYLAKKLTPIALVQYCADEAFAAPELKLLGLGIPVGVGPEIYSTLECRVVGEGQM